MSMQIDDTGIIQVILERFEKQRLPRMIEIKQRLDDGNTINEFELEYLSEAVHDARALLPFLERNPEYEPLLSRVFHYYKIITDEALGNEKK
jgi:hypothetical protein